MYTPPTPTRQNSFVASAVCIGLNTHLSHSRPWFNIHLKTSNKSALFLLFSIVINTVKQYHYFTCMFSNNLHWFVLGVTCRRHGEVVVLHAQGLRHGAVWLSGTGVVNSRQTPRYPVTQEYIADIQHTQYSWFSSNNWSLVGHLLRMLNNMTNQWIWVVVCVCQVTKTEVMNHECRKKLVKTFAYRA